MHLTLQQMSDCVRVIRVIENHLKYGGIPYADESKIWKEHSDGDLVACIKKENFFLIWRFSSSVSAETDEESGTSEASFYYVTFLFKIDTHCAINLTYDPRVNEGWSSQLDTNGLLVFEKHPSLQTFEEEIKSGSMIETRAFEFVRTCVSIFMGQPIIAAPRLLN